MKSKTYVLAGLAIIFFFIYSSIYFSLRPQATGDDMWIFNTPDETANYFFIERLAQENSFRYSEPLNQIGQFNLVHPRSTKVVNDEIVPGNFAGFLLIMAVLAKLFSVGAIPFLIPIFSVLAVVCFYSILKKIFSENIAFWSSVLLLLTPAFWYYNSRSLFNNVLFIDFLIIGVWFLFRFLQSKKIRSLAISGILLGLALSMRASDLIWVAFLVGSIFIYNRKNLVWKHWLIMAISVILAFLPVLIIQNNLYGSPLVTGYNPEIGATLSGGNFYLNIAKQLLLPFGFHVFNIISNLYYFFVKIFWWQFALSLIGVAALMKSWRNQQTDNKEKYYLAVATLVIIFVAIYYGSWKFFDNLIASPLIGSSQTRYLLPVYILSLPWAAKAIIWLAGFFKNKKINQLFIIFIVAVFGGLSADVVLYQGPESLMSVKKTVLSYHEISKNIRNKAEPKAVIVSGYSDKLFFPKRAVIFYWHEPEFLADIEKIVKIVPVYFYSIDYINDINYIVDNSDLSESLILEINEREALYRLR